LVLSFTVLFLATAINYGSIRQSIDYALKDIEHLFHRPDLSFKKRSKVKKKPLGNRKLKVIRILLNLILICIIIGCSILLVKENSTNAESKGILEIMQKIDSMNSKIDSLEQKIQLKTQ
jgi:hypothetical protein